MNDWVFKYYSDKEKYINLYGLNIKIFIYDSDFVGNIIFY